MPNYFIQAKKSSFDPFTFDEYVKPLEKYKEYYEKNEEAVTEMQEQAELWKNIMESEKDSALANKYNDYVSNLENATQQLKNGMSYNLRNQIQQLRGQSAMVKQIENAYNLRAKDIDAYNEMMMKDPSRIGADDPSQRKLDAYMSGPVTNNWGVSGDRLYALGLARAKAMSAQNTDYVRGVLTNGSQYFMDMKQQGYSDEQIAAMLKDRNSELYNEVASIIKQEGVNFNNKQDMDRAVGYTINGMLSGFSYDINTSYKDNKNFLSDYQKADLALKQAKIQQAQQQAQTDLSNYHQQLTGNLNYSLKSALMKNPVQDPVTFYNNGNPESGVNEPSYNLYKDLFNKKILNSEAIIFDEQGNMRTLNISRVITEANVAANNNFNVNDINRNAYKDLCDYITNYANYENEDKNKYLMELRELYQMNELLKDVPGDTTEKKYNKLVSYYTLIDSQKIYGMKYYDSSKDYNQIQTILKDILKSASVSKYNADDGSVDNPEISLKDKLLKDSNIDIYPSSLGLIAVTTNGDKKEIYVINTGDADVQNMSNNIDALRQLLNVEFTKNKYKNIQKDENGFIKLTDNFSLKIEDNKYIIKNNNIQTSDGYEIEMYDTSLLMTINQMVNKFAVYLYNRAVSKQQESSTSKTSQ